MIGRARFVRMLGAAIVAGLCLPSLAATAATAATPAPDRKFTVAVIPDTQNYLDYLNQRASGYPFDAVEIFYDQMAYIARNVESAGGEIAFVTHVGDVWQHQTEPVDAAHRALGLLPPEGHPDPRQTGEADKTRRIEMAAARRGFEMIHGKVPFSVVPGNHDYDATWEVKGKPISPLFHYGGLANFNEVFGERTPFFRRKPWRVASFNGGADSATVFSAGGYRFLHIGLEYAPLDDVIAWADGILRRNPGLPTIVTIHDHLNRGGERRPFPVVDFQGAHPEHNNAEDLWRKLLSRYPQVFLVLSGHQAGQSRRVDAGAGGGKVWQLLADYQDRNQVLRNQLGASPAATIPISRGLGDGWMRLLDFDFSGPVPKLQVRTYSTYLKVHAGELPTYAAWYKAREKPDLSDRDFLAEEEFTLELDDFVQRFGTPGGR
jgi:hypothetical protein